MNIVEVLSKAIKVAVLVEDNNTGNKTKGIHKRVALKAVSFQPSASEQGGTYE